MSWLITTALAVLFSVAPLRPDERTTAELLQEILAAPNEAPGELFEAIGLHANQEALSALKRSIRDVTRPSVTALAVHALRHFNMDPYRRNEAMMALNDLAWMRSDLYLLSDLKKRNERMRLEAREGPDVVPRAAVRSLLTYGDFAGKFLEEIVAEHRDEEIRQVAIGGVVERLVKRGTEEDFERIVENYRPGLSGTFEVGVHALARFECKGCEKRLGKLVEDRRVDDEVRAMVLVALERKAPEDDAKFERVLTKQLRSDAPEVQQAALEGLTRRRSTKHGKELERISRDKNASRALRHAAFLSRGRLLEQSKKTDELRALVLTGTEDDRFEVRMAATTLLGGLREREARDRLVSLLEDASPEVRLQAIDSVLAQRFADAIPILITRLEGDSHRVRRKAYEALQLLTGLDHGFAGPRWRHWWEGEGAGFALPSAEAARKALEEREDRRAESPTRSEFFGIPIRSDRVIYVLDRSGSMDESFASSGRTRFQYVRSEWINSVAALPDGARTNLVLFADAAVAWKREMVTLEGSTRGKMLGFLGSRPIASGATNLWAGLASALRDPDVETVVLLTDGQPTVGSYTGTRAILNVLRRTLELRGVVVHTVSVIGHSDLLMKIAEQTGGQYRELP
jgi:hypothetical protein